MGIKRRVAAFNIRLSSREEWPKLKIERKARFYDFNTQKVSSECTRPCGQHTRGPSGPLTGANAPNSGPTGPQPIDSHACHQSVPNGTSHMLPTNITNKTKQIKSNQTIINQSNIYSYLFSNILPWTSLSKFFLDGLN